MRIVSAGEILWDVFPTAQHLGGATFNLAANARRLGHEVFFASGVGDDERGRRALKRAAELGLPTRYIQEISGAPTGTVGVQLDDKGTPVFTIHRPAAYDLVDFSRDELGALLTPPPDWIAFGTLAQMSAQGRSLIRQLVRMAFGSSFFYDVNLRADSYTEEIVRESLAAAALVKLNDTEVAALTRMFDYERGSIEEFGRTLAEEYRLQGVCVTLGERGCVLLLESEYVESPGYPVEVADTVGAGDAFSAALLHGIGEGWTPAEIADFANRVGALISSRAGATPDWTPEEARALKRTG